jgi:molecular chaperone IbpA
MNTVLTDYFKPARIFGVGFEDTFRRLDEMATANTKAVLGYPPYNIIKTDENKYLIELAVAGFGKQDIEVELKDNTLLISGKTSSDVPMSETTQFLHKGIADRAFARTFNLADTIEIKNAELINGMLKIWLENIIPEHKKPRKIEVKQYEKEE